MKMKRMKKKIYNKHYNLYKIILSNVYYIMEQTLSLTTAILTPVAMYTWNNCIKPKIRNPTKIQKHVLLLPSRSGKSYLYSKLASQKNYMVIDVDEFLKTCSSRDEIDRLDMAKKNNSFYEYDLYYKSCADKVLKFVREQIKGNKSLKVLFISSCFNWASQFKKMLYVVHLPTAIIGMKFLMVKKIIKRKNILGNFRQHFLDSLPSKDACSTYNSLKELEELVRRRLNLNHHL